MVMGTSPASSEIQKCIREAIKDCKNTIHIKDDILVFGVGQECVLNIQRMPCEHFKKKVLPSDLRNVNSVK